MIEKVSGKQIIMSLVTALFCGVIFNVMIPFLALFVFDIIFTFAAFLDPLHAGAKIDDVWDALVGIIIVQTVITILASISVAVVISFLTEKIKTGWFYLFGVAVSLAIYCFFQLISVAIVGLFAIELVVITWALVSLAIVGFFSIMIGLICVGVNKKMATKNL